MKKIWHRSKLKRWFVYSLVFLFIFSLSFFLFQFVFVARLDHFLVESDVSSLAKVEWYQNNEGEYYFFLPKEMNREELYLELKTNYSDVLLSSYDIDGTYLGTLKNGMTTSLLLKDEFMIVATMPHMRSKTYKVHVLQSDLASVFIQVDGGDSFYQEIISDRGHTTYYPGVAVVFDENHENEIFPIQKIRGRGNSTWLRPKKPFQVKLYNSHSFLGMNDSKKWLFIANHWDYSLSRNYLWYQLAKELEIPYSVDCKPIDFYIQNQYLGSYLATNKIDRVGDSYLFEITNTTSYDIELSHGYRINIKYPDLDHYSEIKAAKVKRDATGYLNRIESMIYDSHISLEELGEFVDILSFVSYYWIQELSENYDASRGSNYLYMEDGKLVMGPIWDMDNTLNRSYRYASEEEHYLLGNQSLQNRIFENWFLELSKKEGFMSLLEEYFVSHVDTFDHILVNLDEYQERIQKSATLNFVRWSYENIQKEQQRVWIEDDIDFDSSIRLLKESIKKRLCYYKNEYGLENNCKE